MRLTIPLALAALILAAAFPAGAAETIYKWTDAEGTVHYGALPPEGVDAEQVLVTAAPKTEDQDDPYAEARKRLTPDPEEVKQREEQAQRLEQQRQEQARLEAACVAQRDRLEQMIPRAKVLLRNPDGTTRMLDDDERQRMIDESQTFIDENCQDID